MTAKQLDQREPRKKGESTEQLLSFLLKDDPLKFMQIKALLPKEERSQLLEFLWHNVNIFAWLASDMPKIFHEVITHKLNVDPKYKPIYQKKRNFALEWWKAIDEKVNKLLAIGFIWEGHYLDWLANIVMVKKVNGKWWIHIDCIDLNKACSKDSFLPSKIDHLVDATSRHKLLCFINAFLSYNQLWMAIEVEKDIAFLTKKRYLLL